ncbi:TAXI family TRAP transporter solute-binding subunit [Chloroflexota bacterium]
MKKKITFKRISSIILSLLALLLLPVLAACNSSASDVYEIEIYGGRAGMSSYTAAIAMAELINQNSEWLKATAVESPSITANFQLLLNEPERRPDTLIVSLHQFHMLASEGKEPFTTQYDGLRFIATTGYNLMGFITLDPDIKTIDDFRGKRVSIGDKSSVTRVQVFEAIFESAGILDEVELEYLGISEGINALRDGLIDATVSAVNLVNPPDVYAAIPAQSELASTKDVYYVSINSEDITYMNELLGPLELEHVVPAGSMGATQAEDWTGLGKPMGWAADEQMPDDVVYEICRIIYENADKFVDYSPALAYINNETMANWDLPEADMHPGALQFYEDYGIELGSY